MDRRQRPRPNLPVTVDFAIDWKGGNYDVFYLFDDFVLPASPLNASGQIEIRVMNPPGNADLGTSHLAAYFSNATGVTTGNGTGTGGDGGGTVRRTEPYPSPCLELPDGTSVMSANFTEARGDIHSQRKLDQVELANKMPMGLLYVRQIYTGKSSATIQPQP